MAHTNEYVDVEEQMLARVVAASLQSHNSSRKEKDELSRALSASLQSHNSSRKEKDELFAKENNELFHAIAASKDSFKEEDELARTLVASLRAQKTSKKATKGGRQAGAEGLQLKDFDLRDCGGAGDCGYLSLIGSAKHNGEALGYDVQQLRNAVAARIEDRSHIYLPLVDGTIEEHTAGVRGNQWIDHLEFQELAILLKRRIVILENDRDPTVLNPIIRDKKDLCIFFRRSEMHYLAAERRYPPF